MNLREILADQKLTEEKLFSAYEVVLKERFAPAEIKAHPPDKFQITLADGREFTAFTKNLWLSIRNQTTDDRVRSVEYHVRALEFAFEIRCQAPPKREDIVPMIKDSVYLEQWGERLVREHLAGDIWVVYGLDLPTSMKTIGESVLQELGLKPHELRPLACENLRRILPEIQHHGTRPWYLITAGGDYVASILLLDEIWENWEESIDGDIVVAVPSRDVLLVTGSRSKEGLQAVRQKARHIEQTGDHVISQTLLRRTAGKWKVFE